MLYRLSISSIDVGQFLHILRLSAQFFSSDLTNLIFSLLETNDTTPLTFIKLGNPQTACLHQLTCFIVVYFLAPNTSEIGQQWMQL